MSLITTLYFDKQKLFQVATEQCIINVYEYTQHTNEHWTYTKNDNVRFKKFNMLLLLITNTYKPTIVQIY